MTTASNKELSKQMEGLVRHFDKNLSGFIIDGDVPSNLRGRLEFLQDQMAELYLTTVNSSPVIKVIKPMVLEHTHAHKHVN